MVASRICSCEEAAANGGSDRDCFFPTMTGMRGLSVFISDIRNCQNKEAERLRVDKELGNIRTCFKNEKVRRGFFVFFFVLNRDSGDVSSPVPSKIV